LAREKQIGGFSPEIVALDPEIVLWVSMRGLATPLIPNLPGSGNIREGKRTERLQILRAEE
jgi:hypothetical protein